MNWFQRSHETTDYGEIIGETFSEALQTLGIQLEKGDERGPGRWIARGKASSKPESILTPQSGQYGTYGVFFADHSSGIITPDKGYIYITDSSKYDWLIAGSHVWKNYIDRIARDRGLTLTRISDGIEAESIIYHSSCVYQPIHGYATIPEQIDIKKISHILRKDGNIFRLTK